MAYASDKAAGPRERHLGADDALCAVSHGASGIIVSNHGARQLDTTPATISVLPEIIDEVAGAVEVYVDGGIRRGTDCSKQWLIARGQCW